MFNSEWIVVFWFVPVVFFIIIPLLTLCVWSGHQVLKRIFDKIKQTHGSAKKVRNESQVTGLRSRPAV